MKIIHLIWDDIENPWIGGGGAVRTHEINRRLAKRHEITVITGNFPNAKLEEREGVKYLRAGIGRTHFLSLITYPFSVPFYLRKLEFDLVVDDFCAYSPAFAPLFTRNPVVALVQNLFGKKAIRRHKFLGFLSYLFEELSLHLYEHFLVISPSIEKKLKKKFGIDSNIQFIANAPEAALFSLAPVEKDFILFLGRLEVYQKGLDIIVKAFAAVTKTYPHIKLKLAGPINKKDKKKLDSMVEELRLRNQIEFVGIVSGKEKTFLLSHCLFVCMPSRYEGWPIVAIEAQASQKPVIGSNIPGLKDVVKDGETGLLVKPDNPEKLSEAMIYLIGNATLRQILGKNARQWAKNFSWDKLALLQEKFYIEVVSDYEERNRKNSHTKHTRNRQHYHDNPDD